MKIDPVIRKIDLDDAKFHCENAAKWIEVKDIPNAIERIEKALKILKRYERYEETNSSNR